MSVLVCLIYNFLTGLDHPEMFGFCQLNPIKQMSPLKLRKQKQ